jgi:hypothetical protein
MSVWICPMHQELAVWFATDSLCNKLSDVKNHENIQCMMIKDINKYRSCHESHCIFTVHFI